MDKVWVYFTAHFSYARFRTGLRGNRIALGEVKRGLAVLLLYIEETNSTGEGRRRDVGGFSSSCMCDRKTNVWPKSKCILDSVASWYV